MLSSNQMKNILSQINQEPVFRGLERQFQQIMEKEIGGDFKSKKLSELGLPVRCHGTHGVMDLYSSDLKVGMELKVVKLTKKDNIASKALYDIGQLSSDAIDLGNCNQVKDGYLVVLFVAEENLIQNDLPEKVMNRFKADYVASERYRHNGSTLRILQNKQYSKWQLDNNSINNLLISHEVNGKLAIGIIKVNPEL
jgi:hypothetical protein